MLFQSSIKKTIFSENNLRLVHEHRLDKDKSFFAIYVNLGSALENSKQKGLCHLVEHLMFKSSTKHTALELAKELEKYGAKVNAYTSFESICFHFSVLNENFEKCFKIFAEMFLNKNITPEEFELEKNVVLQEYFMSQDNPSDLCENAHFKYYFGLDPIIGFEQSIKNLTLGDVNNFINKYFNPRNIVLSAVTSFSHHKIKKLVKKYYVTNNNPASFYSESINDLWEKYIMTKFNSKTTKDLVVVPAKTQHSFVCMTIPTMFTVPTLMYGPYFSILLSSGLSSVLYREVREKRGLCYGIHTSLDNFDEPHLFSYFGATFMITTSTEPSKVPELLDTVSYVMNSLPELITKDDIERTKNSIKSWYNSSDKYGIYNAINFDNKSVKKLDWCIRKIKKLKLKQVLKVYKQYVLHNGTIDKFSTVRGAFTKRQLNKLPKCAIIKPNK